MASEDATATEMFFHCQLERNLNKTQLIALLRLYFEFEYPQNEDILVTLVKRLASHYC